jgi:RNA methyltransferase, TrmH family
MKEILSAQHPLIKYWTRLGKEARFRKSEQRVLLEGKNCIRDVCKTIPAIRLIVTKPELILQDVKRDETILVTDALMKKISGVESPEGIMAELTMPPMAPFESVKKIVVADRIQDPGNLGTLIRSALAFGWDGFFLINGTADPFNDKALRAAKGATFNLPLYAGGWEELGEIARKNNLALAVADVEGEAPSSIGCRPLCLILGNEAQGAKLPQDMVFRKVALPMKGSMESLNVAVAGSILLYLYQDLA